MKITESTIAIAILSLITPIALGAFGGMVNYLFMVVSGQSEYKFMRMLANMLFGVFVGILADLLMKDFWGQSYAGVLLLSSFFALKLLSFLDRRGFDIFIDKLVEKKHD